MIAPLVVALLSAVTDPCAPVQPAPSPDPAAAAAYRKVARAERAAGSRETATAAYRAALAHDPSDSASRAALGELCREGGGGTDPFAEGLRLMEQGKLRGAVAAFQRARARRQDPSADLLEGICHYRLGEYDEATPLLRSAQALPAHADAARFYLGLVAMQRGAGSEAASYFDSVVGTTAFGPAAADLARLASREGRLVLSFLGETNWDSNVTLRPDGAPATGDASDGGYAAMANVLYRPLGPSGLFVRGSGMLHQELSLDAYNLGGLDGAVGWELGHRGHMLVVEYDYGYRTLGGRSYLNAQRLSASGWMVVGDVALAASYFVRLDSYASVWSAFSGVLQRGEVKASRAFTPKLRLGIAYGLARDSTDSAVQTWFEHGPRAQAVVTISRRTRLLAEAGVTFRTYDVYDPTLSATRSDTYLDANVAGEYDLGRNWTARLSLIGRRASSNVSDFTYSKIVPTLGLAYVIGM